MRPRRFNLIDQLGCIPAGQAYAFDVAVVRSAAAAENVDLREAAQQIPVLFAKLLWIARVQFGCIVEFRMAALRRVSA